MARKLFSAAWAAAKATVPHGGAPAVLLQHWWRLRCSDEEQEGTAAAAVAGSSSSVVGSMDLRGLGTATVSLVGLEVLRPACKTLHINSVCAWA